MAAQAPPTFKLVLVGDGGTGKASVIGFPLILDLLDQIRPLRRAVGCLRLRPSS